MPNIKIGKYSDNDIVLPPDDRISRHHATLEIAEDGTIILNDHSSNGTIVNGYKLHNSSMRINRGDAILFAGIARFDWDLIPSQNNQKSKMPFWWFALPIMAILAGLVYYFLPKPNNCPTRIEIDQKYHKSGGMIVHAYYFKKQIKTRKGEATMFVGLDKRNGQIAALLDIQAPDWQETLSPFVTSETGFLVKGGAGNVIANRHTAIPDWLLNNQIDQVETPLVKSLRDLAWTIEKGTPSGEMFKTQTVVYCFLPSDKILQIQGNASLEETLVRINKIGIPLNSLWYHNNPQVDLALLKVDGSSVSDTARFFAIDVQKDVIYNLDSIAVGGDVYLEGFSGGFSPGSVVVTPTFQAGMIKSNQNQYKVNYDMSTEPGSSGSPVLNACGKLIAVHQRSNVTRETSGAGIWAKYVRELLDHQNVVNAED